MCTKAITGGFVVGYDYNSQPSQQGCYELNSNSIWTPGPTLITVVATEGVTMLKYQFL